MKNAQFDIAISFSGHDRQFAHALRDCLIGLGLSVFYDEDYQAALVGSELTEVLPDIYRDDCLFCVMVISSAYLQSVWAKLERRAALEKALAKDGHVIPIRLDDTQVPGLRGTIGYLDARQSTIQQIGNTLGLQVLRSRILETDHGELDETRRFDRQHITYSSDNPSSLPSYKLPSRWDFAFDMEEYRRPPEVIVGGSIDAIPLAQAHLHISTHLLNHMPEKYHRYLLRMLKTKSDLRTKPATFVRAYAALSNLLQSLEFAGQVYSLQLSFLNWRLQFLGHPQAEYGTSAYDVWPADQVDRMFFSGDEEHRLPRLWQYFAWEDNIAAQSVLAERPRRNIGLLDICGNHRFHRYGDPQAMVFGEVHLKKATSVNLQPNGT
ncbi:MAG TPA: toll/interleukin-1 receptor domain-containing protein [Armatimonadota bacterium]|jgi:hypothetical protein